MRVGRAWRPLSAALGLVLAAACAGPEVGPAIVPPPSPAGYRLALTGATVDLDRHVVVTFTLTQDAVGVPSASVATVARPTFTLAGLLTDPVSGLQTWQSYLLTGSGTLTNLPLGGPGTPPAFVLANQKQPGAEAVAAAGLTDLGGGAFSYTFAAALPAGYDPARTVRVGAWLAGVAGSAATSAVHDFVPAGGAPAERLTALDASCNGCHGDLSAHGGFRRGVRLCLTCHTIQNADPDTTDPAAMGRGLYVVPSERTVYAGAAATSLAATLLSSSAAITWTLAPAAGAGTLVGSGASATYQPPASLAAPITVTLTASAPGPTAAAGLASAVTLTVLPAPASPAVVLTPAAQTLTANGPATPLSATLLGLGGPVAWSLSPASGAGALSATAGAAVSYTPPGAVSTPTIVSVIATAGGVSAVAAFTITPGPAGAATRFSDPNPLDLGRMVHRIHRGKLLPTLYLSSSLAPAPALPSASALPLPFLPTRNPTAAGTRYAITGFRGTELVTGRVVQRADNFQPARQVAEGVGFPRDLRDCDVCHQGAPQAAEVVSAIARRTCQGCHPDVWFGTGPATDLVHFPHTGGPQADDTQCAGCHVPSLAKPTVLVPIAAAHLPVVKSPDFDRLTVEVVGVTGFTAGNRPTVAFTVTDRNGSLDRLDAPTPAADPVSPVPRALSRVAITISGPTSDYLTGNVPLTEVVPLTLAPVAQPNGSWLYTYTFTITALPAGASGTWGLGVEARRQTASSVNYDVASDAFRWPYTGEPLTEYADNPVLYLDTTAGTWPGGAPLARRESVEVARCQRCHLEINLHGGLRHLPAYCVLCHTPDTTDWNRRPKGPGGNTNLSTVYSPTQIGTYDGLEERSVHFKVMIHRIHTGEGQGRARLEVGGPHLIYGFGGVALAFDDVRFPGKLTDCTLCHPGATWLLSAIPAAARPTVANETATVQHLGTAPHQAGEPAMPPQTAACISCHGTTFAIAHASTYTVAGVEQCGQCHAKGALSVATAHGLTAPAGP